MEDIHSGSLMFQLQLFSVVLNYSRSIVRMFSKGMTAESFPVAIAVKIWNDQFIYKSE